MSDWGLSPQQLREQLRSLEWENRTRRRARLLGQRPMPMRASLRAPTARQALNELDHLQRFVTHWQDWPGPGRVLREIKNFRQLGQQQIPVALELDTLDELFRFLGRDVQTQMQQLSEKMQALLALD